MEEEPLNCRTEIATWFQTYKPNKGGEQLPAQMRKCFTILTKIRNEMGSSSSALTDGISADPDLEKFEIPGAGDDFKRTFLSQWNVYVRKYPGKKKY